jgi:hypothetical protein
MQHAQPRMPSTRQAAVAWSVWEGHTGVLTRSPSGAWSTETVLTTRTPTTITVSAAIDGAGNAIAVFGSSYSWDLAGGKWQTAAALPSGSSGRHARRRRRISRARQLTTRLRRR